MNNKSPDYLQCVSCLRIVIEYQMKDKNTCHVCAAS